MLYSCRETEIDKSIVLKQDISEENLIQKVRSIDGLDPVEQREIEEILVQKIRKSEDFISFVNLVLNDRLSWEEMKNKKRVSLFIEGVDLKNIKQQLPLTKNYNDVIKTYREIFVEPEKQIERINRIISLSKSFFNEEQEVGLLPIQTMQKVLSEAFNEEIKSRNLTRKSNVRKDCFFDCGATLNLELDKQDAILLVATWACMMAAPPQDIACGLIAYANYSIERYYAFEAAEVCFNGC